MILKSYKKTVTNSSRCTFLSCPFKYFCEYILLLTSKREPEYFQWGSLVHRWAEEKERGLSQNEIFACVYEEIESRMEHLTDREVERLELQITILPTVFRAHEAVWGEIDKRFETLESERKFSMVLKDSNNWTFEGKIDGYKRDQEDGEIYQWERKTSAKTGRSYWKRLVLDSQPKGYILASQRAIGMTVNKVIYDVFKKPSVTRAKYESVQAFWAKTAAMYEEQPRNYMERGPFTGVIQPQVYKQSVIDEYYWDLIQVTEMLDHSLINGLWPKHHPGNLVGECGYFPLCKATSDAEFEDIANTLYYKRDAFHPELKEI